MQLVFQQSSKENCLLNNARGVYCLFHVTLEFVALKSLLTLDA